MNRHLVVAIAASLALLAATPGAQALPPGGGFGFPGDPVIVDPCDLNPEDCLPPPPVDPCDLEPTLPQCEPEPPIDPCDLSPIACEPEEPTADPGEDFPSHMAFAGSARVKGQGVKTTEEYVVNLDWSSATFLAIDGGGRSFTGHIAPKGPSGVKFRLFLDDASATLLARIVLGRAVEAAGVPEATGEGRALAVLGSSEKLTLRVRDDGSATLKIKCEALGVFGAATLTAQLTGPVL